MPLNSRGQYKAGAHVEFDTLTGETLFANNQIFFEDEFVGAGHTAGVPTSAVAGYPWIKKIVGAGPPTVGLVSNASGGQMALALNATSEKEDGALYMGDNLGFDVTKGLVWEARVNLSVLPSVAAVQMVMGVQSAWIDGPDNASFYLGFGFLGNGKLLLRSKDGVTTNAIDASSVVPAFLTTDWHILKFDATDVTNVRFSVDGNEISGLANVSFAATGANAIVQGYASVYKASGVGVGTLNLDNMQMRSNRA